MRGLYISNNNNLTMVTFYFRGARPSDALSLLVSSTDSSSFPPPPDSRSLGFLDESDRRSLSRSLCDLSFLSLLSEPLSRDLDRLLFLSLLWLLSLRLLSFRRSRSLSLDLDLRLSLLSRSSFSCLFKACI